MAIRLLALPCYAISQYRNDAVHLGNDVQRLTNISSQHFINIIQCISVKMLVFMLYLIRRAYGRKQQIINQTLFVLSTHIQDRSLCLCPDPCLKGMG